MKIKDDEKYHIIDVLRHKKGDKIRVMDGQGTLVLAEIIGVEKREIKCKIIETLDNASEPKIDITLGVGAIKTSKLSDIVDQTTQLGANGFVPLLCDYSEYNTKVTKRWNKLSSRLQNKSIAAVKQSFRTRLPEIYPPANLHDLLCEHDFSAIFYADPEGLPNLPTDVDDKRIFIAVGPEGGFSQEERRTFYDWRGVPISLGRRRLRTEVAATTLLTKVMVSFGEI